MDPRGLSDGAGDRLNFTCSRSMWFESDDEASVTLGAESARIARNACNTLRRANDNLVAGGRSEPVGTVLRNNRSDGQSSFGERIGMCDGVRRKVYHESVAVSGADRTKIPFGVLTGQHRLVSVSEPPSSLVCSSKIGKHCGLDLVVFAGQVSRLVMSPKSVRLEIPHSAKEVDPRHAAHTSVHFLPMHPKMHARNSVTGSIFERTGVWTGDGRRSGNRDRACLGVFGHQR